MIKHKPKIRVIVRPWTPRIIPYAIPTAAVRDILKEAYPQLKKVLYVGWIKRKENNKSVLYYLAATGETAGEARKNFKKSVNYGIDIWKLGNKS